MKNIEVLSVTSESDPTFMGKIIRFHLRESYLKPLAPKPLTKWVDEADDIFPITIQTEHVFNEIHVAIPLSFQELESQTDAIEILMLKLDKTPGVYLDDHQLTYIYQWIVNNFDTKPESVLFNEQMSKYTYSENKSSGSGMGRPSEVNLLPGLKERVKHPINGTMNKLESTIINLNDRHRWTVNQIADWLETLDIDLTIRPVEDKVDEPEPTNQYEGKIVLAPPKFYITPFEATEDEAGMYDNGGWLPSEMYTHFDMASESKKAYAKMIQASMDIDFPLDKDVMKLLMGEDFNEQD